MSRASTSSPVTATRAGLVLGVETGEDVTGCPDCGVVAVGHGRRQVRLHDIPCFGKPVMLLWAKRVWRCPDRDCTRTTFTEDRALAGPRAKLTARDAGLTVTDPDHVEAARTMRKAFQNPASAGDTAGLRDLADYDRAFGAVLDDGQAA